MHLTRLIETLDLPTSDSVPLYYVLPRLIIINNADT